METSASTAVLPSNDGVSALVTAVAGNQLALVRLAVECHGVPVNGMLECSIGSNGALVKRSMCMIASYYGCPEVLSYLLTQGADPNQASSDDGATALHCACDGASPKCYETILLLLGAGALKDVQDCRRRRPVDLLLRLMAVPAQTTGSSECTIEDNIALQVRLALALCCEAHLQHCTEPMPRVSPGS